MIEVRALTKTYGDQRAVNELSFTAPAGQVAGFLGPNGAGKTTTFRCLLGLATPTSGTALIGGRVYRELASPRHHVGVVLESTGFHPARTGRNHLRVIARAAGVDAARIDVLLELVGLGTTAGRGSTSEGPVADARHRKQSLSLAGSSSTAGDGVGPRPWRQPSPSANWSPYLNASMPLGRA